VKKLHPTQNRRAIKDFIKNIYREGDVVIDPYRRWQTLISQELKKKSI
jgi:hypothetical protein